MAKKSGTKKQASTKTTKKVAVSPAKKETARPGAEKASSVQQPRDDSNEIVVFAIRIKRCERDLIHKAAGSGKASQFVRTLAVAAATGDLKAVQEIVQATQPQS